MNNVIIEKDSFPFEIISQIAEKESWRKEVNRPLYHLHKWWAKRLGSVFRAILLGCVLPDNCDFIKEFYSNHSYPNKLVFDPFMGSGTTIGEASKIGMTSLGQDINPVAAETVKVSLNVFNNEELQLEFKKLEDVVGKYILNVYKTLDSKNQEADVLYYFWVMQANCSECKNKIDLFSNYILSSDAYPKRKPSIQIICPNCGQIFESDINLKEVECKCCKQTFDFRAGTVKGKFYDCPICNAHGTISKAFDGSKPKYRLYGKLILTNKQKKEFLKTDSKDLQNFEDSSRNLSDLLQNKQIVLPDLNLAPGHNTQQAINYGFKNWRDFFNDRQLLLLGKLSQEISKIQDEDIRSILSLIFSATLEFNNLFASYKGEGTGAVRHMFSHHILKPERTPIEPNLWGTSKSSGSFSGIFKSKIKKIIDYRISPREVHLTSIHEPTYSLSDQKVKNWKLDPIIHNGGIYLSCGDSSKTSLEEKSIDFVVTDPPFFDNVHYSELADFFYSWLKLNPHGFIDNPQLSTRNSKEVQDSNSQNFSTKLETIFIECNRVLKDTGLLIFSYHHSKEDGWTSISKAIYNSGFYVENYHPIKSEMSVATPKHQAKEPIQLDIILVCKKIIGHNLSLPISDNIIIENAKRKARRLENYGFGLSLNDRKIILYGELLKCNKKAIDDKYLTALTLKYSEQEPAQMN